MYAKYTEKRSKIEHETEMHDNDRQARCYVVNGGGQVVPDWLAAKKKGERRKKKTGDDGQGIRLIQVNRKHARLYSAG